MIKNSHKIIVLAVIGVICPIISHAQMGPAITNQPVGAVVNLGSAASLSAGVSGTNISFQWLKDGVILQGQTNSSISFSSFQFTNDGNYQIVASNACGMAISVPASLSVPGAPLQTWGYNGNGQLGTGNTFEQNSPVTVTSNVVAVAAGEYHSLFVTSDGMLWGMGYNSYGQLGIGNNYANQFSSVAVASNVVAVAAGEFHSLFVTSDGRLWAMGYNYYGQLGTGNTTEQTSPVAVASNVVAVAAGAYHSLFVTSDGRLWAMGYNGYGQLGIGTISNTNLPVPVASNVVAVAAGGAHSLFVTSDGRLWGMGYNYYGQLGIGNFGNQILPVPVASNVVAVAAGGDHSLFVTSDGRLWGMGYNYYGQLGIGNTTGQNSPVTVASNVVEVAAGGDHSLFVTSNGSLWSMGDNNYGQLGIGNTANQTSPVQVSDLTVATLGAMDEADHSLAVAFLPPKIAVSGRPSQGIVSIGQSISLSVTVTNNSLGTPFIFYQWLKDGVILQGQTNSSINIGSFQFTNDGNYQVVASNANGMVVSVPASLSVPGAPLQAWGDNVNGQLGIGTALNDPNLPVDVTSNVVAVAAGEFHSLFVTSDGRLWGMGDNGDGDLGIGNSAEQNSPVTVTTNVVAVAAGDDFSLFVTSDGTLWGMGDNYQGQLGIDEYTAFDFPVTMANNVVAVAAGYDFSLFVTSDGRLWATTYNGVSSVANNVVAVAAGYGHFLFVTSDGRLWGMGLNNDGQLGIGNTSEQNSPVTVASNVVEVAAGEYHSLFVTSDGRLWGMGLNNDGQLGIGNTANKILPVFVASNVVEVAAGQYHSLFVRNDGTLWAMGYNADGQLGIGNTTEQTSPVQVSGFTVASLGAMDEADHSLAVAVALVAPQISPLANQAVMPGQPATFTLNVTSSTGPYTYQWQMDGTNIVGATNSSYTIGAAEFTNAGAYTCIVTGLGGSASNSASLAVYSVSGRPPQGTVSIGQSISLSVTATNNSLGVPFSYQWLKDGVILQGQTNSNISFGSFQFTNDGNYQVAASNAYGMAISVPASLSVPGAPLQAWGDNYYGQLGIGNYIGQNSPVTVTSNVVAVAAGYEHSLFVTSDGRLWAVGENNFGQLGIGNTANQALPVYVASNVVAVAAGQYYSLFVRNDGTLWAMGDNADGQLGTGNYTEQNSPVPIASNVVAVAAGYEHSLFVTSDGRLRAMGDNADGDLGNGTNSSQTTSKTNLPVTVASNVVAVAAGGAHSLFVTSNGRIETMGDNYQGQLGLGNIASQFPNTLPFPVTVASNVVAVSTGDNHSLFVTSDGMLWGMGYNSYGQLGIGNDYANQFSSVAVASNVVAVAAGEYHSLFVTSDGSLWAMGYNSYGQLGIGNTTEQTSPVQVPGLTVATLGGMDQADHSLAVALLAPQISPMANQAVMLGQRATFILYVARGTGPFTYQWQMDGTNIAAATNISYTIAAAAVSDAGTYTGIVNGWGGTASNSATLTVSIPPPSLALTSSSLLGAESLNLQVGGLAGSNYVLQVTTNLTPPIQWMPLQTNVADANGACLFIVTNPTAPELFYRIALP